MNVLVIPEDFRKDQYILKPLFSRLMNTLEKRSARVVVCTDPKLGSVTEALKLDRIAEVVEKYRGMVDIFILCVDRDGKEGRRQQLDRIEQKFGIGLAFFAVNAWEELETWVLAGLDLPNTWRWADVRTEVEVKEQYFDPLVEQRGLSSSLGGGRKVLGEKAARRIGAIRQKCSEDFDSLARRLEAVIQTSARG